MTEPRDNTTDTSNSDTNQNNDIVSGEPREEKCPNCQFEQGEHSFECPQYKEKPWPMEKEGEEQITVFISGRKWILVEAVEKMIGEEITNWKDGKPEMCWKCSYWGKDCKCESNQILKDLKEKINKE